MGYQMLCYHQIKRSLYVTRPHRRLHLFQFFKSSSHNLLLLLLLSSSFFGMYKCGSFFTKPLLLECMQSPFLWAHSFGKRSKNNTKTSAHTRNEIEKAQQKRNQQRRETSWTTLRRSEEEEKKSAHRNVYALYARSFVLCEFGEHHIYIPIRPVYIIILSIL